MNVAKKPAFFLNFGFAVVGFWKRWEFEHLQLCFFSIWVFAYVSFWVFEYLQMCVFEYLIICRSGFLSIWVGRMHSAGSCWSTAVWRLPSWILSGQPAHNYLSSLWPQEHRGKIELTVLPFSCSLTYLSLAMRAIYKWQGTILDLRYTLQVSRASRIPQSKRTDKPVGQLWWESTDERPRFQKA